jgi:hypothetical protein
VLIYKDFNKGYLRVHRGILKNMNSSMLQLTSDKDSSGLENFRFFEGGTKKIYAIYNKNYSELLSLKAVKTLNVKLRKPELQKTIIKKIRPCLNNEVAIVLKKMETITVVNGLLSDMGISEVVVKPAPFFNAEERINYNTILNIYNSESHDVIEI